MNRVPLSTGPFQRGNKVEKKGKTTTTTTTTTTTKKNGQLPSQHRLLLLAWRRPRRPGQRVQQQFFSFPPLSLFLFLSLSLSLSLCVSLDFGPVPFPFAAASFTAGHRCRRWSVRFLFLRSTSDHRRSDIEFVESESWKNHCFVVVVVFFYYFQYEVLTEYQVPGGRFHLDGRSIG